MHALAFILRRGDRLVLARPKSRADGSHPDMQVHRLRAYPELLSYVKPYARSPSEFNELVVLLEDSTQT